MNALAGFRFSIGFTEANFVVNRASVCVVWNQMGLYDSQHSDER